MGRVYDEIDDRMAKFLLAQPVFFVGTAPLTGDGHINLSPKGLAGSLAVLDPHTVAYLDLTGSGVETIAHLTEPGNSRIVVMFCSFEGPPRIVRLHGTGRVHLVGTARADALAPRFAEHPGVRSVIEIDVTRVADSCGYGVPEMAFVGHRTRLGAYWDERGPDALVDYWAENNASSLDGLPGVTPARVPG